MHETWGEQARFVTVYIKEAHPEDEWQMKANETEDVCYKQPRTMAERLRIANDFATRFRYPIPLLVDDMENGANALYAGWPERLYVIAADGRIVYKGEPGPFGYHPEEVEAWLRANLPAGRTSERSAAPPWSQTYVGYVGIPSEA